MDDSRNHLPAPAGAADGLQQFADAIDEAFWLADCASGRLLHVNPAGERLWARPARLMFRDIPAFVATVHPEDVPRVETWLAAGWSGLNGDYRIQQPDGAVRWVRSRTFPIPDDAGRVYRSATLSSDITEAHQLEAQSKQMSRALEQTADAVMITDRDGVIEYVNAAFEDISGYTKAEVIGRTPALLRSGFQEPGFYSQMWQLLLNGLPFSDVFINRRRDGELYYEEKTITPVRDEQGNITHFVSTGKDITRRLLAQQRLHRVLHYDAMTGLANRILFVDRLGQALLQARRLGLAVGVLHVGFDLAALFGEELGRVTEERFQGLLAQHLREAVAEGDTVARLGRDEFVILHKQALQAQEMEPLAQRIMLEFAQPLRLEGYELFLTPAIGISRYPGDGTETEELLHKALLAMRQAREGGAHYAFYRPEGAAGGHYTNG
jgi:PAS domain S-box/diguanylate cyclase (GGDEF) domain